VRETWSTIGHHNTITDVPSGRSGRMAYRAAQRLDAVPAGKRVYLWIGATDGSAKLFVNGKHVPFTVPENAGPYFRGTKAGDVIDAFRGYCRPGMFDITSVLKAGENQFTILAERTWLNEIGTGGLMGPVVLFREK
jgi:beta-galactosidase/beta-glucuronidase